MKIQIEYDCDMDDDLLIIKAKKKNPLIIDVAESLERVQPNSITLIKGNSFIIEKVQNIYRFFCENSKVYAENREGTFETSFRLYELENKYNALGFIKVNSGELINLKLVKKFDFGITGSIYIYLKNESLCKVSRRSVKKIKQYLGV